MAEEKKGSDTMKELRDWLVTKCRLPGFGSDQTRDGSGRKNVSADRSSVPQQQTQQQHPFSANIVTPRTIPQFIIPGSNDSSRQPSVGSNDDLVSHSSGEPSVTSWSASTSPGVSPRSSFSALAAPEISLVRIRSAPVSPRRDSHGFLRDFGVRSMSNLPHLPVDQAPSFIGHSAAKRNSNGSCGINRTGSTSKDPITCQRKGSLTIPNSEYRSRPRRMHRSFQDFYASDERIIPTDFSHSNHLTADYRGTYSGLTDKNEYLPMKESFRRSKRYYRRRSSLVTKDVIRLLCHHQAGQDVGDSSSGGSPHHGRNRKQLAPIDPFQDKRHSSPEVVVTDRQIIKVERSHSLEKPKTNTVFIDPIPEPIVQLPRDVKTETERGDVKFSFQYFPATKRLKVIIIRAENLKFPEKPDLILNPFFKICLMPGKLQKQTCEPARQTCNPVLNKEFFFTDLSLEEMKNLRLRILAFHKAHHLKLPEYLGEVNVPLSNYDLLMENRMWNDLHFKPYKKDLGHLQVELLLDSRLTRLIVGVAQARGLPSQHLTGAPDPYVRVAVWQFGQLIAQFQTSVKKNTTAPVFNETFESQVNIRSKALSHTRVTFSVHDRDRLRGDPLIGHVIMGLGATEESVIEHWDEVMVGNGRKVCRWHYIMDKGETHEC